MIINGKWMNCDFIWGFMCTCHYSYDDEEGHHQVGQDVPRKKLINANTTPKKNIIETKCLCCEVRR